MIEVINSYHVDYWVRNKIIDCGQVLSDNNQINITIDDSNFTDLTEITELENHLFNSEFDTNNTVRNINSSIFTKINSNKESSKEKLNNNYKCLEANIINESKYQYNKSDRDGFRNSKFNKPNRKGTNPENNFGEGDNRIKTEFNRVFTKQTPDKHINIHQKTDTNYNKRTMQILPKNSRIHELKSRERFILLDSFSKPKLRKN